MRASLVCALIGGLALACDHRPLRSREVVYLVDVTASLTPETHAATIDSMVRVVPSLNRGDELVVIPVTDDAQTETLRNIVRIRIPLQREPYDADLRRVASQAEGAFRRLLETSTERPYQHTDLLGAFRLAAEELDHRREALGQLVCISDFVQDDQQFNFKRDSRLAQSSNAKLLAAQLAQPYVERFRGVTIYLGSLPSLDTRRLATPRRDAIRDFWINFLEAQSAVVHWKTDGVGHVGDFLEQPPHGAE